MRRLNIIALVVLGILSMGPRTSYSATVIVPSDPSGKLEIEKDDCSGALSGSFFQMYGSTGGEVKGFAGEGCGVAPATSNTFPLDGKIAAGKGLLLDGYQYNNISFPSGSGFQGIVVPFAFFGVNVYLNTSPTDYQAGSAVSGPHLVYNDTACSGDICPIISSLSHTTAWDVFWSGNNFNQGAPKPDGSFPSAGVDGTVKVTGAFNTATQDYRIQWRSLIVGGGFNNFTGHWQLAKGILENCPRTGCQLVSDDGLANLVIKPNSITRNFDFTFVKVVGDPNPPSHMKGTHLYEVTQSPDTPGGNPPSDWIPMDPPARICLPAEGVANSISPKNLRVAVRHGVPAGLIPPTPTPTPTMPWNVLRSQLEGPTVDNLDGTYDTVVCADITGFSTFGVVAVSPESGGGGGCGIVDPRGSAGPTPPGTAAALILSLFLPILWILVRRGHRHWVR